MKFITKHIKFIIAFVISFALTLIFLDQLCELLLKISKGINYKSTNFRIGYLTISFLLFSTYIISISKRYIHHTRTNLIILYTTSIYFILRFLLPSNIDFNPINSNIKYADIIIALAFLHLLNVLIVENKFLRTKKTKQKQSYFIDDGLYVDGELDNEKILQKLIEVITDYKPEVAFSIGLNAVWGYGKSSFLHRFKNEYEAKNSDSIIFWNRIWKNKGSTAIIENFFDELKDNLSPYSAEISEDINNYVDSVLSLSSSDLKKIISFGKQALSENATLEKFYTGINENIKKIDKQIIILLDDLDRLEKPEILNTFKIIRTLSDFNNVIFIAGYDRKYIVETIDMPKDNYLDKIFNVEINLLPFDEQLIIDELIRQVDISFPFNQIESDELGFNKSFKELFTPEIHSLIDIKLGNLLQNPFNCSNRELRYQDFLKTYRDVKKFVNEFKFNAGFLDSEFDVVGKEYILLKLLTYRFRDLNNMLFANLNRLLSLATLDEENDKLQITNSSYNNIYVYDLEAQKKINLILSQYAQDEIEIINSVLCKLFGGKHSSFYQNNQNAISKIYYTEVYLRNNIAGGKISLSDLQREFSNSSLIKIAKEIIKSADTKFQLSNELKQFIFNNESKSKDQYLDSLRTLNILVQYGTSIDDQKIIDILRLGFHKYYLKDKKTFLFELSKIIKNEPIGYLDKLLSEINMDFKRKESKLAYGERIRTYKNNEFSAKDIKGLYYEKLKYQIETKQSPNLITTIYNLFVEKIVADKKIIRDKDFNNLLKLDISIRFLDYFRSDLFISVREEIDDNTGQFVGYEPNFTLAQIFSNPKTHQSLINSPQDIKLLDQFYTEGWNNFYSFIESINLSDQNFDTDILEKINFMKKFVKAYIENNYKPLSKSQYDLINPDLPF